MKRFVVVIASVVLGALIWQQPAVAQTVHYVDNLRTCADLIPCYATITDALNAAAPFDVIEVFPCVYRESVVFDSTKSNIVLQAHSRALRPVIAAPSGGNSAIAIDGQVPGVQVLKFIIEGGVVARGLLNSAVIQDNRVTGGIRLGSCHSSTVKDNSVFGGIDLGVSPGYCVVDGNTVSDTGIRFAYSDYLSTFNVISHNVVVGGDILAFEAVRLLNNRVESNLVEGGSIKLSAIRSVSDTMIRRNVVRGGGIVLAGAPRRFDREYHHL